MTRAGQGLGLGFDVVHCTEETVAVGSVCLVTRKSFKGEGCACRTLRKCIVDKNARIAENVVLVNKNNESNNTDHADKGFIVKDGIIVIFKDGAVPAGFEY